MTATAIWALGQIGKHTPEHAKALALTNVFPKIIQVSNFYSNPLRASLFHPLKFPALIGCTATFMKIVYCTFKFHMQTSRACGLALQCIESHSSQLLRNATRTIHMRATKCVEVGGDTFENL